MIAANSPTVSQGRRTFSKRPACILGFLVAMTLCGPLAQASEVYAYLGGSFSWGTDPYMASDRISGVFYTTLPLDANLTDASIIPAGYNFSDGYFGWSNGDSTISEFLVTTDAYATLVSAEIVLSANRIGGPWGQLDAPAYGHLCLGLSACEAIFVSSYGAGVFFSFPNPSNNMMGLTTDTGKWGPDFDPPGPSGVPEPCTLFHTLPALLAVAFRARTRTDLSLRRPTPVHHC